MAKKKKRRKRNSGVNVIANAKKIRKRTISFNFPTTPKLRV